MATDDRKKDDTPEDTHPIDPPVSDDERYRLGTRPEQGGVSDVGRTMGGGSLGHAAPDAAAPAHQRHDAGDGTRDEPTRPSKGSSVNTKP